MLLSYRSETDYITNMYASKVSQLYEVLVIRCRTLNSHDRTRNSRQTDKALMHMATRSWSPAIQQLLVDLLNEGNDEAWAAHNNVEGKRFKAEAWAGVGDPGLEDLLEGQSQPEGLSGLEAGATGVTLPEAQHGQVNSLANDALLAAQLAYDERFKLGNGERPVRDRR